MRPYLQDKNGRDILPMDKLIHDNGDELEPVGTAYPMPPFDEIMCWSPDNKICFAPLDKVRVRRGVENPALLGLVILAFIIVVPALAAPLLRMLP